MALEEYGRKRNFAKTPEPPPEVRTRKAPTLFFCVQKHLASHLHYDFRLEWNGVLLSWAVPKGPSLDPNTRRFAAHVEDHPFDYGEFEGVIPEGYGAGIVMLWDKGTWSPEVSDVDAALKKGDLKFTLDGVKLKGSWVLVRTRGSYAASRGSDPDKTWLLIKHRDEWSGELDIAAIEDFSKSVKSGGDFEDILAEDTPAVWISNKPSRPSTGGEAGALLAKIIEKAAALKAAKTPGPERSPRKRAAQKTQNTRKAKKTPRPQRSPGKRPTQTPPPAKIRKK